MNPSDLAIIAVAAVSLAHGLWTHRLHMKVVDRMADRVRVVNPVKQPQPVPGAAVNAAGDDKPRSILERAS